MSEARRVVAITGAGGTLGAALSHRFAGEPDTDVVLSDVSAPIARRHRERPAGASWRRRDVAGGRERSRRGRRGRHAWRSERFGRLDVLDQQCRRALSERAHPQPDDGGLGARVPGQRPRCRQRHPRRSARHARAAVGVDHPHGLGRRAHRVVARRSVLRDEGGRDPGREGRSGRVRVRRDTRQLRVSRHLPVGDPRGPAAGGNRHDRGQAPARAR